MKAILKFLLFSFCCTLLTTCKKSAEYKVYVYNEKMHEYVPNAEISLIEGREKVSRNPFSYGATFWNCKVAGTSVTDNNGCAIISSDKIKRRSKYGYHIAVTKAWGRQKEYNCGHGELLKSDTELYLNDLFFGDGNGSYQLQYNGLFNNSVSGDSLIIWSYELHYSDIRSNESFLSNWNIHSFSFDPGQVPYPPQIVSGTENGYGIFVFRIKKIKSGNTSIEWDTIRVYPDQSKLFQINW